MSGCPTAEFRRQPLSFGKLAPKLIIVSDIAEAREVHAHDQQMTSAASLLRL